MFSWVLSVIFGLIYQPRFIILCPVSRIQIATPRNGRPITPLCYRTDTLPGLTVTLRPPIGV